MSWRPTGDGQDLQSGGYDGQIWAWELVSLDGSARRTVLVKVTGTAMISETVHFRVKHARESKGQTEIWRVLEWDEPPEEIELSSASTRPLIQGGQPGPAIAELTAITEWFEERGILLVFSGRAGGTQIGVVSWQVKTANLIDPNADELVARFEAQTRLDAAHEAQQWWREDREPPTQTVATIGSASEEGTAMPIEATQGVPPDAPERLKSYGYHVIVNAPAEEDPDSGWMIEAYDDAGALCGLAVQPTLEDAWLTLLEDLIPSE